MLRVAVLISGRGSNLKSLIAACATPGFPAQIVCVVSNKTDAKGLDHARASHIPTIALSHRTHPDQQSFEVAIDAVLVEHKVELVCLAGFMRILSPWFTERWHDRLINIHPSLLPSFPGLHSHKKALDAGVKLTGCTVHFVRAEMDHGPIILQAAVPVFPNDDEESLAARVLQAEHKAYPAVLRMIAEKHVNVFEERTFITDADTPDESLFNPKS